ncbi:MAG: hypothetical protein COB16_17525 [Rhodobacteraceae bacterium]|nr:MAG: hypothetical protein COB16_17525 [Paracoccaceae bacterium]
MDLYLIAPRPTFGKETLVLGKVIHLDERSILADPRVRDMEDRINRDIKGRETYRPFAPVIAEADVADWFDHPQTSSYMSFALPWRAER